MKICLLLNVCNHVCVMCDYLLCFMGPKSLYNVLNGTKRRCVWFVQGKGATVGHLRLENLSLSLLFFNKRKSRD